MQTVHLEAATNKCLAKALDQRIPLVVTDQGAYELDKQFQYWKPIPNQDLRAFVLRVFDGCILEYIAEVKVKGKKGAPDSWEDETRYVDISNAKVFKDLECYLRVAPEFRKPEFFDEAEPGFTCRNGFISIVDGIPRRVKARPENRSRVFLDFSYDEKATCPYTQEVVDSFFVEDADGDGPGKKQALWEFYAMCLLGQVNKDKRGRILWVTGEPDTGKSTLLESLNKAIFPDEFKAMVDPKAFGDQEQLLDLVGKLINFADEVDEKTITNTATIRKVVSGSEMKVRQLYRGHFNARFIAGHLMIANLMPRQADESGALLERTIHLHFTHRFKRKNEAAEEVERQIVAERAGIINLLLSTYCEMQKRDVNKRNVQAPASAIKRRTEMLEDANIYRQFVKVLKRDENQRRRASDLLRVFNLFKATHGYTGPFVTSGVLARKVLELKPDLKLCESGGAAVYGFVVEDETEQLKSGSLN